MSGSRNLTLELDESAARKHVEMILGPRPIPIDCEFHMFVQWTGGKVRRIRGLRDIEAVTSEVERLDTTDPALIGLTPALYRVGEVVGGFYGKRPLNAPDSSEAHLHSAFLMWVDIDDVENMDEALMALITSKYPPSLFVKSGHGLHCYYLLARPFQLNTPENVARFKAYQRSLVEYVATLEIGKADPAAITPIQPMRLPGTWNRKPGREPRLATLHLHEVERRYRLRDLPPPVKSAPPATRDLGDFDVTMPDPSEQCSPELQQALDAAFTASPFIRRLWEGSGQKFRSPSHADWCFANQLSSFVYDVVDGAPGSWLQIMVEALAHFRWRNDGGSEKAARLSYLLGTAGKVWGRHQERLAFRDECARLRADLGRTRTQRRETRRGKNGQRSESGCEKFRSDD